MTGDTLQWALGAAISIVIWFVKGIMSDLKAMKGEVIEHDKEIGIIKSEQSNSNKRFDKLDENFKALADKIDTLIMRIPNNNH